MEVYALCMMIGAAIAAVSIHLFRRLSKGRYLSIGNEIIQRAQQQADTLLKETQLQCKQEELDHNREMNRKWQKEKEKLEKEKERLAGREDKLDARQRECEAALARLSKRETELESAQQRLSSQEDEINQRLLECEKQWEKIAGMDGNEAKSALFENHANAIKTEAARYLQKTLKETHLKAEEEARKIVITAINRLGVPCASEHCANSVEVPNESVKGRIIGKEGRNIRTFERLTGVTIVVDDTPGAVLISGYDPIRIEVAKTALKSLVKDGRIHPTRIEETVQSAETEVKESILKHGEEAALKTGQFNLHPELLKLLGKLKFRHSYAQNVLVHSIEVSLLMGMMAAELELDEGLAKRIGLLHDIGKAASHERRGSHALIGHDLALKYGEKREVANGIGSHHRELKPETPEASLCETADAISGSRPGARQEAVDHYLNRMKKLEEIAARFPGVEKAYALQAGKELRVILLPGMIDDAGALNLARDISKEVERQMDYPGQIKVAAIRESQFVEYAR